MTIAQRGIVRGLAFVPMYPSIGNSRGQHVELIMIQRMTESAFSNRTLQQHSVEFRGIILAATVVC
jgi:hypothetical protein